MLCAVRKLAKINEKIRSGLKQNGLKFNPILPLLHRNGVVLVAV
jgi:hypothetical protein